MNIIEQRAASSLQFARSSDGVEIAFKVAGTGRALACLHGFSESHEGWEEAGYVEPLVAAGYQVILIDSRGHGRSGKPHQPDAYSGSLRIADLVAVLDRLGHGKALLLGHSMGGTLALAAAAHIRERVAAVIAIGAHPFSEDLEPLRHVLRAGLQDWMAHLERQAGTMSQTTRRRIADNDPAALSACAARNRADFSAQVSASDIPLLAIVGSEDERKSRVLEMTGMPNTSVKVAGGLNHCTSFAQAGTILPIILNFLQDMEA
nr:alpha/beta hydrolase [Rhizobium sp. Q54]